MQNKEILQKMIMIYKPTIDWMGFRITKKNHISYHHINEKRNKGTETIENGALLTKLSHKLLHKIEFYNYKLYLKWQSLFLDINIARKPLDDEMLERISILKEETLRFFVDNNILHKANEFNSEHSLTLKKY